jgi:hypothetical protein
MTKLITRAYNRFEIDQAKQKITKISATERLKNEADFYKNVPEEFAAYFPRVLGYSKQGDEHRLELELYSYNNLGSYVLGNSDPLLKETWTKIAQHLRDNILEGFQKAKHLLPVVPKSDLKAMYEMKTKTEYDNLVQKFPTFEEMTTHPTLQINGKRYKNFHIIWEQLMGFADKHLYENAIPSFVHGDLCFSNILFGKGPEDNIVLKLIDPRGSFGSLTNQGDLYYDLAKLMHSTDVGYELIIGDKIKVVSGGSGSYHLFMAGEPSMVFHKTSAHKVFCDELYSKFNKTKIKFIQGLIYIGMCARHYDSEQRQLYMFLSGVKVLNEVLEELTCVS